MEDAIHIDRFLFDRVEDQIVLNNKVAASQSKKFLFVVNPIQVWIIFNMDSVHSDNCSD